MRSIQFEIFGKNQFDTVKSICEACDKQDRIKDFRSVGDLIKISPMLIDAKKIILLG